jgi:hypothetical protein
MRAPLVSLEAEALLVLCSEGDYIREKMGSSPSTFHAELLVG